MEVIVATSPAPHLQRFSESQWLEPGAAFEEWAKVNWDVGDGVFHGKVCRFYNAATVTKLPDLLRDDDVQIHSITCRGELHGRYVWVRKVRGDFVVQVSVANSQVTCRNLSGVTIMDYVETTKLLARELRHMVERTLKSSSVISKQTPVKLVWADPPAFGPSIINDARVLVDPDPIDAVVLPQWLPKRRRRE